MRIEFSIETNKNYCMVNLAHFKLPDGTDIGIDRCETEWSKDDMLWRGCYLWAINGDTPFGSEEESWGHYPNSALETLLKDAKFDHLELEDDADDDYKVTVNSWGIV